MTFIRCPRLFVDTLVQETCCRAVLQQSLKHVLSTTALSLGIAWSFESQHVNRVEDVAGLAMAGVCMRYGVTPDFSGTGM
jgi:hypothetical protein